MSKPLCAVILAGGVGSRFWPFLTDKMLIPFAGKPLIQHTVFDILPPEVSKVVLVTNIQNRSRC